MVLKDEVKRQLESTNCYLKSMLENHRSVNAVVLLEEEPGDELITMLMTNFQIQSSIERAVKEFYGDRYKVSEICITCGKKLITFKITKL